MSVADKDTVLPDSFDFLGALAKKLFELDKKRFPEAAVFAPEFGVVGDAYLALAFQVKACVHEALAETDLTA